MANQDRGTFGATVRQRIDSTEAVKYVMAVAKGTVEGETNRLKACQMLLDRTSPTLKAVAVILEDKHAASKHDIDAMLLQAGLQPELEWQNNGLPVIEHDKD